MVLNRIKVTEIGKECDFSTGIRGKFYHKDLDLNLPVYLEPENFRFIEKIAKDKKSDLNTIVNKLIKENIKIAQVLR